MSADGDTVRDDFTDVKAWAFYYAPEPLKSKLERVLARLEAAEAELAEYTTDVGYAAGYQDGRKYAEAQRDALAEALRECVRREGFTFSSWDTAAFARAALAEAGLE